MKPKELQNLTGRQIAKFRNARSMSQSMLAVQCQIKGLDISRECIAKMETGIHYVEDFELPYFARIFNVSVLDLYPALDPRIAIHESIGKLLHKNGYAHPKIVQKSEQPRPKKRGKP